MADWDKYIASARCRLAELQQCPPEPSDDMVRAVAHAATIERFKIGPHKEAEWVRDVAARLQKAHDAMDAEDSRWKSLLRDAYGDCYGRQADYDVHWLRWLDRCPCSMRNAVLQLWAPFDSMPEQIRRADTEVIKRIRMFRKQIPPYVSKQPPSQSSLLGPGPTLLMTSVLVTKLGVCRFPVYRPRAFGHAYSRSGYRSFGRGSNVKKLPQHELVGKLYRHALDFLDKLIEEARERGFHLRDRLEAGNLVHVLDPGR